MALTFGGATSDRVDCGSGASTDDVSPYTMLAWVFPTTLTANRQIFSKGIAASNSRKQLFLNDGSGNLRVVVDRATTDTNYVTSDTPLSGLSAWYLVAATFDAGATPAVHIYTGSLTAAATERTYGTAANGSGAVQSDAAENVFIGNSSGLILAFQGRIAAVAYISGALSLGQIRDWQFDPRVIANTRGFWRLGHAGTGTQPDWSGNGNSGAVTGATVSGDAPLRAPFASEAFNHPVYSSPVITTPGAVALGAALQAALPVLQALPGAVALSAGVQAATPVLRALPSAPAIALSTPAPSLQFTALPPAVALTASLLAPTPILQALPVAVSLLETVPDATPAVQALPGAGGLALSAEAPTPAIQVGQGTIALLLTVPDPAASVDGGVIATPGVVVLTVTLLDPTVELQALPPSIALSLAVLVASALATGRGAVGASAVLVMGVGAGGEILVGLGAGAAGVGDGGASAELVAGAGAGGGRRGDVGGGVD